MRRTGRTFRAIMEALKLASEGNQVIYECTTLDMAKWSRDKALRVVEDFMKPELIEKMVIKIGNGSVRFVSKLDDKELRNVAKSNKYNLVQDS